jgi:long-chain fatty acid transport protein
MKMKRCITLALGVALAALASPAYATNGMRMIGFGASQVAMGGTSTALSLDAASIITNPAGIIDLGPRVDFGASWFMPQVSYQGQEIPNLPQPGMIMKSQSRFDSQRGASPVPAFGLVFPLGDRLALGVGAYGIAGMGVDYADNLYSGTTYSSYSQMRFAPGIAWKPVEKLSLGVTANVMYAEMGFDAASGLGQVAHQGSSAFGAGATFGAHYSPLRWLTLGAAYETKSWFQDFAFNVGAHQALDMSSGQMVSMPAGTEQLTFNQPQSASFGVAGNPWQPLLVGFDVQWINWSDTNGQNLPAYQTNLGSIPWSLDWNDQWVFKVGAQYRVLPQLALRAGYNYGKMPLDPNRAFENIAFPAVTEHHITGGVGIDFSQRLSLNVAGMYAPEATLRGGNAQQQYIASYQTSMSQVSVDMGLAYRF